MNSREKWLIISYFLNLDGCAQAHWIDDRLPFLAKANKEVILLSSVCGYRYRHLSHVRVLSMSMKSLKEEVGCILSRTNWSKSWKDISKSLIYLLFYPLYFVESKIIRIGGESQWGWILPATITSAIICLTKRPSLLYSSGGPVSAHIATALIARMSGIPWIAELQDPLVGEDISRSRFSKKALAYCEKVIFTTAGKVIYCTIKAKESAEKRYPLGKGVVIYPGVNTDIIPQKPKENKSEIFSIGHFGALYQSRNLEFFFASLREAFVEEPDMSGRFALELYGGIFGEAIKDQINNFPYKVVNYHGMVKRQDSLIQEMKSDVLLLIQNTDQRSQLTIPSKVYEYLYLRKPILGLVFNNEELKIMLESHGHIVVDANNVAQMKNAIITYYHRWDKGQLADINQYALPEFTVKRACEQLINLGESSITEKRC
jgi:hypothetical protein